LGKQAKNVDSSLVQPKEYYEKSAAIWTKMRGDEFPPPPILRSSSLSPHDDFVVGDIPVSLQIRENMPPASKKTELIDAVSIVLDAHGVLERLTDEGRAELIFDLVSILESAE
jgi:hypothetical protein